MEIHHWPVDAQTAHEAAENYRTTYALKLEHRPILDIIRELTFDGAAPRITPGDLAHFFGYLERTFLQKPLAGVGIEVGSGPLVFSAILAQRPAVEKMYGIEICAPIIERLYPQVSRALLGPDEHKTVGVVGSFDEMQLADASVDFAFDFFSLHHSLDINVTLGEIHRVLKPGGFLLMLDKARPDTHTPEDLDALMDYPYGEVHKRQFGLPLDQVVTRRMNGEREYRLKDWKAALVKAGFGQVVHHNIERTTGGGLLWRGIKTVLSWLPVSIQVPLVQLLPQRLPKHKFILSREGRVYTSAANEFRKETSLIIAYKP